MDPNKNDQGLEWQIGVWDRISELYAQEVDRRFVPVVEAVIARAALKPGERVLDLGTGTGSVAVHAAAVVGPDGSVIGSDISSDMLLLAHLGTGGLEPSSRLSSSQFLFVATRKSALN